MALLNTDFLTARTQTFRATRHIFETFAQEGVKDAGDYKVTPTGVSLQWSVAAGAAMVRGEDTTRQGLYPQVNDGAVTGLVAAGHATNPRIDQVILRVFDSSVTGVSDTPTLSTLAGTATGGATLDNRTGAAALPNGAIRLADILVPAAHSGVLIANTHIRDRRPWARGVYNRILRQSNAAAANDYTTTSTTSALIDGTNLAPRIECSGAPLRVGLSGRYLSSATVMTALFTPFVDGAAISENTGESLQAIGNNTAVGVEKLLNLSYDFVPTAGSHVIGWAWRVTAGTATLLARSTIPLIMTVEEIVRQNASNS